MLPGQEPRDVANRLAVRFGMDVEAAHDLILKGSGRVIKHGLTVKEAERYGAELTASGLVIEIESQDETSASDGASVLAAGSHGSHFASLLQARDDEAGSPAPSSVPIGRGWGWIADAWSLFRQRPWAWIGAVLLFYLILMVLSLVPVLGGLATTILGPMLSAGLMIGAHAQARGDDFRVGYLFAGVSNKPGPLALVGGVYLLLGIGVVLVVAALFVGIMASTGVAMDAATLDPNDLDSLMAMSPMLALPFLVLMLLGIPLAMAVFFAPSLVALSDVPVLRAFRLSFLGCLKNILPFLVFSLVAIAMVLLGSIPFMLGLILVLPILTIAIYAAYRDIFLL
nr:BPSS1780 family membrane protein [Thiocystis minor]